MWIERQYKNEVGKLHKEDGPAVEHADGSKVWFLNGKRHRVGGPAVERNDGYKEWYLNGIKYTEEEFKLKTRHLRSSVGGLLYEKD